MTTEITEYSKTANSDMKSEILYFDYSLNLDCPYCDSKVDFSGLPDHEEDIVNAGIHRAAEGRPVE